MWSTTTCFISDSFSGMISTKCLHISMSKYWIPHLHHFWTTLRPLFHFKFINDLNSAFNKVKTIHFADNTHISHASKKLSTIDSEMNCELKSLAEWLRSNKVSRKSETVINLQILSLSFSPPNKKLVRSSNKVKNYKLGPMQDVTCLGVALDEFLSWDANINGKTCWN